MTDPQSPEPPRPAVPPAEGGPTVPSGQPPEPPIRYGLDDDGSPQPQRPYPRVPAGYPVPPAGGYTVPGAGPGVGPGVGPGMVPPGGWQPDPLIGAPDGGFEDWARRTVAICRRSIAPSLVIAAITCLVPAVAVGMLAGLASRRLTVMMPTDPSAQPDLGPLVSTLAGWYSLLILASVVLSYLQSAGWAAVLRIMARDAVGAPRDIGGALTYGLRRGLPLWGWYLVMNLCVLVGACACVLPGVYLALALSMIAPIVVFERGQPAISRSFRLMHSHFWPMVGRLVVLALCVGVYSFLVNVLIGLVTGASQVTVAPDAATLPSMSSVVVSSVLQGVLALPATVVGIAGILAAYAELRARERPVTSAELAAATA